MQHWHILLTILLIFTSVKCFMSCSSDCYQNSIKWHVSRKRTRWVPPRERRETTIKNPHPPDTHPSPLLFQIYTVSDQYFLTYSTGIDGFDRVSRTDAQEWINSLIKYTSGRIDEWCWSRRHATSFGAGDWWARVWTFVSPEVMWMGIRWSWCPVMKRTVNSECALVFWLVVACSIRGCWEIWV